MVSWSFWAVKAIYYVNSSFFRDTCSFYFSSWETWESFSWNSLYFIFFIRKVHYHLGLNSIGFLNDLSFGFIRKGQFHWLLFFRIIVIFQNLKKFTFIQNLKFYFIFKNSKIYQIDSFRCIFLWPFSSKSPQNLWSTWPIFPFTPIYLHNYWW